MLMGVKILIFWLSGKEQKQSNLGIWGGEGSGEDSVLTRMQGRRIIGEKAWLSVLVPETRWLEATSPSVASPRSILAPIFPRHHAPIAATVSRAPLHQASKPRLSAGFGHEESSSYFTSHQDRCLIATTCGEEILITRF